MEVKNEPAKASAFLEYTVNLGRYNSVKIMGGLSVPLEGDADGPSQLAALTEEVAKTLAPFVESYKKQREPDDTPKPGSRGGYSWGKNSKAAQSGATRPMSQRTNQQKPSGPPAQAEDIGDGLFAVTVSVDKVYDGRVSQRTHRMGPGTIVASSGEKYDTFDKDDLVTAREAMAAGARLNIVYSFNENYQKNIIDGRNGGSVSIFGANDEQGDAQDAY